MLIRKAVAEDAQSAWDIRVSAILAGCSKHYPADSLAAWTAGEMDDNFVASVQENYFVGTIKEKVVATGMINLNSGILDALAVCPSHMGCGYGKQIVEFLESLARDAELNSISLDSTLNAANFYRSCGFTGEKVGIYHSPRGIELECIPMNKQLD